MKFFTSDTHFFHKNVIKYSKRPYSNIEEMHEDLIDRWNRAVKKGDLVYHLGDFTLETDLDALDSILGRLNGRIVLIKGNHDRWVKYSDRLKHRDKFLKIVDYEETNLQYGSEHIKACLMHYPLRVWNRCHYGSVMLAGHSHGSLDNENLSIRRMDVGVDSMYGKFAPISELDITKELCSRPTIFHHDN